MIMQDQSRRLSQPLRWGRREKAAVIAVILAGMLAVIGLGVYALTGGSPARADCIHVTFASTLGGAELNACGAQARRVCASGQFRHIASELRESCRRAGLPYVAPPPA